METQSTFTLPYNEAINNNQLLAEKIIRDAGDHGTRSEYVKAICSHENFVKNPTSYIISGMIDRYVGRYCTDDCAREFVMKRIPRFIESVSSPDYLKSFAAAYFRDNPKIIKIMEIFEKSIGSLAYLKDLEKATTTFNRCKETEKDFYNVENYRIEELLRIPLTVFHQSEKLQEYSFPADVLDY